MARLIHGHNTSRTFKVGAGHADLKSGNAGFWLKADFITK
jgi:hypothetical protein